MYKRVRVKLMETNEERIELEDMCLTYHNRCKDLLEEIGNGNRFAAQAELMDSLEEKAREEYQNFVNLFVDPDGDVSKRYTLVEKGVVKAFSILPFSTSRLKESTNKKVVERCVKEYLSGLRTEVESLAQKAESSEETYENAIEMVIYLRGECINQLSKAEICESGRDEGNTLLSQTHQELDNLLRKGDMKQAHTSQKTYLDTERLVRKLERQRDKHSNNALSVYHQLNLMYTVYEQSKVYSQFLLKNSTMLEQTYDYLQLRWNEYVNSGNLGDVVSFLRWTEELKRAREVFDINFAESLPLIKQIDKKTSQTAIARTNDTDMGVYDQALSLKEQVLELCPN
jgi:hypothetical protein